MTEDPHPWRAIPDWDNYEVNDLGVVRRVKRSPGLRAKRVPYVLAQHVGNQGYPMVHLRQDGRSATTLVHRIVAAAFLGDPEGRHVDHIDGVRTNCRLTNLRYVTPAENNAYGGERHHFEPHRQAAAKLTEQDVLDIRRAASQGVMQRALAAAYGMSEAQISRIVRRHRWAHLPREAPVQVIPSADWCDGDEVSEEVLPR